MSAIIESCLVRESAANALNQEHIGMPCPPRIFACPRNGAGNQTDQSGTV